MHNLLKAVKATREECQQKLNVLNARQDLEQMQNSYDEIRQGINALQSPIQNAWSILWNNNKIQKKICKRSYAKTTPEASYLKWLYGMDKFLEETKKK